MHITIYLLKNLIISYFLKESIIRDCRVSHLAEMGAWVKFELWIYKKISNLSRISKGTLLNLCTISSVNSLCE